MAHTKILLREDVDDLGARGGTFDGGGVANIARGQVDAVALQ